MYITYCNCVGYNLNFHLLTRGMLYPYQNLWCELFWSVCSSLHHIFLCKYSIVTILPFHSQLKEILIVNNLVSSNLVRPLSVYSSLLRSLPVSFGPVMSGLK